MFDSLATVLTQVERGEYLLATILNASWARWMLFTGYCLTFKLSEVNIALATVLHQVERGETNRLLLVYLLTPVFQIHWFVLSRHKTMQLPPQSCVGPTVVHYLGSPTLITLAYTCSHVNIRLNNSELQKDDTLLHFHWLLSWCKLSEVNVRFTGYYLECKLSEVNVIHWLLSYIQVERGEFRFTGYCLESSWARWKGSSVTFCLLCSVQSIQLTWLNSQDKASSW
jgi:hypothetical protein